MLDYLERIDFESFVTGIREDTRRNMYFLEQESGIESRATLKKAFGEARKFNEEDFYEKFMDKKTLLFGSKDTHIALIKTFLFEQEKENFLQIYGNFSFEKGNEYFFMINNSYEIKLLFVGVVNLDEFEYFWVKDDAENHLLFKLNHLGPANIKISDKKIV